jgi:hypothetical protein
MENQRAVAVLRELLRLEQCNVAVRLVESTVFISRASTQLQRAITAFASASVKYCESLTELIRELGGEPGPRGGNLSSADFHFMELSIALPRLLSGHESLVRYYRSGAAKLSDLPDISAVVSHIADEHQQELATIRELQQTQAA